MSNRQNAIVKSIKDLLEAEGVGGIFAKKGKHPFVEVTVGGVSFKYHFPLTPSCPRAEMNCLTDIRRKIREFRLPSVTH